MKMMVYLSVQDSFFLLLESLLPCRKTNTFEKVICFIANLVWKRSPKSKNQKLRLFLHKLLFYFVTSFLKIINYTVIRFPPFNALVLLKGHTTRVQFFSLFFLLKSISKKISNFMDPLIFPNTLLEKCQNFTVKFC